MRARNTAVGAKDIFGQLWLDILVHMKPEDVAREIDDRFFKKGEADRAKDDIEKILNDFFKREELDTTAEDVTEFLRGIWKRFSIGTYVDIFVDFAQAEKALYGFGESYRDHLMHVFNVHLMGLLIFSRILKLRDNNLFKLLKIKEESKAVPFPNTYDKPRRLYYLWCLISTFHDIAIPIDRRKELVKGFGRYLDYFKIETEEFYLKFPFMTQLDIGRYSDLMSRLFAGGLSLSKTNRQKTYQMGNRNTALYLYFRSTLAGAMNRYNHGVLGAYFLFRSIEEMFLSGKNLDPKYDLDLCSITRNDTTVDLPLEKKKWNELLTEFDTLSEEELKDIHRIYDLARGETKAYNDYIFEQDVTRAALAIALHNIDPDRNPKIFPLKFSNFPLACLLILLDELQEFYRPARERALVLTEVVRCRKFPDINVKLGFLKDKSRIQIETSFDLERPTKKEEDKLVSKYNEWMRKNMNGVKKKTFIKNYDELVRSTWDHIFETIEKKIAFKPEEPLEICVNVTIEGKNPDGKPLEHKSLNWTESLDTIAPLNLTQAFL